MSQLHNVVAKLSRPRHSIVVHKIRNHRRISPLFDQNGRPTFEHVASNEMEMTPGKLPTNLTRKVTSRLIEKVLAGDEKGKPGGGIKQDPLGQIKKCNNPPPQIGYPRLKLFTNTWIHLYLKFFFAFMCSLKNLFPRRVQGFTPGGTLHPWHQLMQTFYSFFFFPEIEMLKQFKMCDVIG